ncbi:MAG: caspase family protein [Treponema sp.]|nr:caspase family protein [Treponema sp.]
MKKSALLIANTDGLAGTKKDLDNFASFLRSENGGLWRPDEIGAPLYNPSRSLILDTINKMKLLKYDYVIVLFSGHGGQKRETVIEINGRGEHIMESELKDIAPRQLSIFDCCRVQTQQRLRDSIMNKSTMYFSSVSEILENIRNNYNNRIMQSMRQQVALYSCSIGQSSYDTNEGAIYLNNLLDTANKFSNGEFLTIGMAHQQAKIITYENSINMKDGPQLPEACLPKCLTEQQLVISINPKYYYGYST